MRTLIVDDEKHCREALSILLSKYCPGVEVVAACQDGASALQAIRQYEPELVFLDIRMPGVSGFDMLEACGKRDFAVIFTTAYNEHAIRAIRHNALDYLLKPVTKEELIRSVARATEASRNRLMPERILQLLEELEGKKSTERIAMPTIEGLIVLVLSEICYCEADNNYTRFHLANGKTVFVCKTLKKIESQLERHRDFIRVHHGYLLNLQHMQNYIKGNGGEIILTNGKSIPVSRTKKQELLSRLEKL